MTGPRRIGLVSATTLVAASMIGVGVYTTSGFTLAALGSPDQVVAAWIVAGVIAICGASGYASLSSRFHQSGGEYLFLSRTLHPIAGVIAGLVSMLAGFTGAIAIAAIGLEEYARPLLGETLASLPSGTIAVASVAAAATLHSIGIRGASRIQDVIVIAKLLMIAGFIVLAVSSSRGDGSLPNSPVANTPATNSPTTNSPTTSGPVANVPPAADTPADAPIDRQASDSGLDDSVPADTVVDEPASFDWLNFAQQLVWISFSYAGFNAAVYVAGEVRDPQRNIPRALVGGTVMVTILYVILNWIFVTSAPVEQLTDPANISQIAAASAVAIGGDGFSTLVRLVIVVSLMTSVSAMVMTGPRVYAKMADDGFLPSWFRFEDRPPVAAIGFQAALAITAILIASLTQLLGYLGLTLSVCSALTVAMLWVDRARGRITRLPLWGMPAAIYVIATLVITTLYAIQEPGQAKVAGLTIAVGTVACLIGRRRKH
ncbi:Serine/threonine exchanger SteT [Rubripirellula lacrimiformis]|uniref:Serine/threonine exchanger SteT n=1 Tax=Rubripirellula lacrimiformis TaxID=1930273 RepID=A0A517NL08_9BACT|nr:Serine/threonine exchanger SteT [Rubripirellula lacrimiformis]